MRPKITEVRIVLRDRGPLKATASITVEDLFVIHGIKVLKRYVRVIRAPARNVGGVSLGRIEVDEGSLFVALPTCRSRRGRRWPIARALTDAAREYVEDVVLAEYRRVLDDGRPCPAGVMALLRPLPARLTVANARAWPPLDFEPEPM